MSRSQDSGERQFLREQSNRLGAQVLQLQRQLVAVRQDNRRHRTTAELVQGLYALAADDTVVSGGVAERCLRIILEDLSLDCAAILHREPDGLAVRCSLGFGDAAGVLFSDPRVLPPSDDGQPPVGEDLLDDAGLQAALCVEDIGRRTLLFAGNASAGVARRTGFDDGDREILRVALSVYLSIHELKGMQAALAASERHYRAIVNSVNDAILVVEPGDGLILDANDHVGDLFGVMPLRSQASVYDLAQGVPLLDADLCHAILEPGSTGARTTQRFERVLVSCSGRTFWSEVGVSAIDLEGTRRLLLVIRDISERRRIEEQLRHESLHDALTGLANRTLIANRVDQALARRKREPSYGFALLFVDLDRFKAINDSLGHAAGDDVLIAVARQLEQAVRPGDTVARLGADEFVVLADGVTERRQAQQLAERLRATVERAVAVGGAEFTLSASIGIALSADDHHRWDELLRDADLAMYDAKAAGRARDRVFHPSMHRNAVAELQRENDLRRAISEDQLELHYQPIVSLADHTVTGFEALVRWRHPEHGLVPPGEFIPLAERTGLIVGLGRWVLREACRQIAAWRARPGGEHLVLSANLSRWQLLEGGLVEEVEAMLNTYGCDPASLCLEITESAIMENIGVARAALDGLRGLGLRLSMDDFGTGYSSLSFLHSFPLDVLKVDRSFVSRMGDDPQGGKIVGTIVALGNSLDMRVVAEGVETMDAARHLLQVGCDYAQGFLFARPLEASAATTLIDERRPVLP